MPQNEIQPRALKALTALYQIQPSWEGSVILSLGLDSHGSALAIAGNIAGAVTLAIDNDPVHLREVARSGACDFVVNTLDEAIRAMKNEVRKRTPLSVSLAVDPARAIPEVIERGLAPQLFSFSGGRQQEQFSSAASQMALLGAALVSFSEGPLPEAVNGQWTQADRLVAALAAQKDWVLHTITFDTPAGLRAFDGHALSLLAQEDRLRRRWLEASPRILQRQRPPQRSLWLTLAEAEALAVTP